MPSRRAQRPLPLRLGVIIPDAMTAAVDDEPEMEAAGRKKQIMRQYPIPVADIQRGEKGGEAGSQVKIGQEII